MVVNTTSSLMHAIHSLCIDLWDFTFLLIKSYGQAYNSKISVVSKQKDIYHIYKLCSYITITISYRIHGFLINNMYYISNSLFHFHSLLRWRRCPTLYYMHVLLLIVIYVLLFILVYTNSWRIVVSGVSPFTGLDHWTGLLDWITGLQIN